MLHSFIASSLEALFSFYLILLMPASKDMLWTCFSFLLESELIKLFDSFSMFLSRLKPGVRFSSSFLRATSLLYLFDGSVPETAAFYLISMAIAGDKIAELVLMLISGCY